MIIKDSTQFNQKNLKISDKLIVALDFSDIKSAQKLVEILGESVVFYKIGLELLMSGSYFEMIRWLEKKNKKIFLDLKLYDIPNTLGKAVKNLSFYSNIHFLTIHCANQEIMEQAFLNKGNINILAVTVLTNLTQLDLIEMGFDNKISLENLVLKKALLAKKCGIDGVVASGLEAKNIRKNLGDNFNIICPGIRLDQINFKTKNLSDDQKRVVNVKTAFLNGANYIVVGRPINSSQEPLKSALQFQQEINLLN